MAITSFFSRKQKSDPPALTAGQASKPATAADKATQSKVSRSEVPSHKPAAATATKPKTRGETDAAPKTGMQPAASATKSATAKAPGKAVTHASPSTAKPPGSVVFALEPKAPTKTTTYLASTRTVLGPTNVAALWQFLSDKQERWATIAPTPPFERLAKFRFGDTIGSRVNVFSRLGTTEKYVASRALFRGGFGTVHLAKNPKGDMCALKSFRLSARQKANTTHVSSVAMIADEIKRATKFTKIVPRQAFEAEGKVYLELPLKAGDLAQIAARIPNSQKQAAGRFIFKELSGWLYTHLHGQGVIHKDIKLDNVLFDETGNVFGNDVGIAMSAQPPKFGGGYTPGYAPARFYQNAPVGYDYDVYALAITMAVFYSNDRPLQGRDAATSVAMCQALSRYGAAFLTAAKASRPKPQPTNPYEAHWARMLTSWDEIDAPMCRFALQHMLTERPEAMATVYQKAKSWLTEDMAEQGRKSIGAFADSDVKEQVNKTFKVFLRSPPYAQLKATAKLNAAWKQKKATVVG